MQREEQTLIRLKEQDNLEGDVFGDGKLYDYASKSYAKMKKVQNPLASGHLDLISTGSFLSKLKLNKPINGRYLFGSTDRKRTDLVAKYGIGIMSLNPNVSAKFQREIIAPRFIREIKKQARIG